MITESEAIANAAMAKARAEAEARDKSGLHPSSKRFVEILDSMRELHLKKAADYGSAKDPLANLHASEAFGIPAWVGTMIRANDKVTRIQSFAQKGELANEPVEDSLLDLAAYAILALVLFEQSQEPKSLNELSDELGMPKPDPRLAEGGLIDRTLSKEEMKQLGNAKLREVEELQNTGGYRRTIRDNPQA